MVQRNSEMAITVGKYHLFERSRRGKTVFYYWFDESGKRVQKACGFKCQSKREAVTFLEELLKADLTETKRRTALMSVTLKDFGVKQLNDCQ